MSSVLLPKTSQLYVEPFSNAKTQANLWRISDPVGASLMDRMASLPQANWIGGWITDPTKYVDDCITVATDKLRVFVIYNIPHRDCGSYSSGGAATAEAYNEFIAKIVAGIKNRLAIFILEPDAISLQECLSSAEKIERLTIMRSAVYAITNAGGRVYIDAGDSNWQPANKIAPDLISAGVRKAAGIALNVSHTEFTANEIEYANEFKTLIGPKIRFVVDTGRNGVGPTPDNQWCNPQGLALGEEPKITRTVNDVLVPGLDALLWIKHPGGSDGTCNGGPAAGAWWPSYARALAAKAWL